jgi:hypothetical protein
VERNPADDRCINGPGRRQLAGDPSGILRIAQHDAPLRSGNREGDAARDDAADCDQHERQQDQRKDLRPNEPAPEQTASPSQADSA